MEETHNKVKGEDLTFYFPKEHIPPSNLEMVAAGAAILGCLGFLVSYILT